MRAPSPQSPPAAQAVGRCLWALALPLCWASVAGCTGPPTKATADHSGTRPVTQEVAAGSAGSPGRSPLSPDPGSLPEEAITKEVVVEGLEHPWGMAWLPSGDLLITERPGRLRIVRGGRLEPRPIAGVVPVSAARARQLFASQQGGLLDVALHPRFNRNPWVYLTYAHGTQDANHTRVARARFDGTSLSDWEVIFQVNRLKSEGQHFGSRLLWLPDDTLLVSIGDGGNPPLRLEGELIRLQAQNRSSHLGKVVRLRDDGTIPPDNPFVGDPQADPAVWSLGHRNIQGMAFDRLQRRVWATEHGSRGGDELNWLRSGRNYGWPLVSFSAEYGTGRPVAPATSTAGMEDPRRVWMATIAPSGLAVYAADRFPQWRGNLFAGGLVAGNIRRLVLDAQGAVIRESVLPIGARVRDVRQGPDGFLYVLTDEPEGRLLRVRPR